MQLRSGELTPLSQESYPSPSTYREDRDLPFAPDGNSPLIHALVEKVVGVSGPFIGMKYARKTILVPTHMSKADRDSLQHAFIREVKALHIARHHHVIRVVHTYFERIEGTQTKMAVVMDRAECSLLSFFEPGNIPRVPWFGCLVRAVGYIHSLGIRHRDIKPSNILVKEGRILLADFGISQMGIGKTMPTTYQGRSSSRTKEYCAPEVESGSTRGRSADIFSLGAVFLEMLVVLDGRRYVTELNDVLKPPSESVPSYSRHIHAVHEWIEKSFHPVGWQSEFLRTCQDMLHVERDLRPSADDVGAVWSNVSASGGSMVCTCGSDELSTRTEDLLNALKKESKASAQTLLAEQLPPDAIHHAAAAGSIRHVQILLDTGVSVNARNAVRQTPLQCAARTGATDVVTQLLANQADVNARDENDQTALHGAAAHGYEDIVTILLQANADLAIEDNDGESAISFATRKRQAGVLALLECHVNTKRRVL